ncbi:TIGR02678 family protein [Luteibacter sp.]|jgi:uncharacterized protein (TIGR02678 family)|uniref:TIGR02678 family protein n=1 Tax=Luteibacter sp. TaxID=1886636 RepID=UPI002F3FE8EB
MNAHLNRRNARPVGEWQQAQQQDEFRRALRALLMRPLMPPVDPEFSAVRRQAERLRDWFMREAGWPLLIDREGARLYKRPANLSDSSRGLPDYDRRRYVLLCLACAVLERADPQITLQQIGERVVQHAGDPALEAQGFSFALGSASERRELVVVCRTLLERGVLVRVAGEEENFVRDGTGQQADALYDVQRRLLAGLLASVRGPSTWSAAEAPVSLEARLHALVAELELDSEQGRRDARRHHLARRLLDDPVLYNGTLDEDTRNYFINQRGPLAARLCKDTGLVAEQRAEGLALADEGGQLTDVAMPAEGTEAHVTLLVAEHLAARLRQARVPIQVEVDEIALYLRDAAGRFGRFWRKSARAPGAERELADVAIGRLHRLGLLACDGVCIEPLPAIARFALGHTEVRDASGAMSLFSEAAHP